MHNTLIKYLLVTYHSGPASPSSCHMHNKLTVTRNILNFKFKFFDCIFQLSINFLYILLCYHSIQYELLEWWYYESFYFGSNDLSSSSSSRNVREFVKENKRERERKEGIPEVVFLGGYVPFTSIICYLL